MHFNLKNADWVQAEIGHVMYDLELMEYEQLFQFGRYTFSNVFLWHSYFLLSVQNLSLIIEPCISTLRTTRSSWRSSTVYSAELLVCSHQPKFNWKTHAIETISNIRFWCKSFYKERLWYLYLLLVKRYLSAFGLFVNITCCDLLVFGLHWQTLNWIHIKLSKWN